MASRAGAGGSQTKAPRGAERSALSTAPVAAPSGPSHGPIHQPSGAGLTRRDLVQLQQRAGNRAVQHLVQRNPETAVAATGGGIAGPARQDTAVKWPFKVNDHLAGSVEGTLKSFDPDASAPSVTAGEFGQAVTKGSLEFSAALLKVPNPLDETVSSWLNLPGVAVSSSLSLFKLTGEQKFQDLKDVDLGVNLGEIEVALTGTFDAETMRSRWGALLLAGSAAGRKLLKGDVVFEGAIKLSIALPADDAARLVQIAAHHKQLRAMAYQTKMWTRELKQLTAERKALEAAYDSARGLDKVQFSQKLGRNLSSRQALAAKIRKNKKLGRSLLAETAKLAKALSPALKATLSRFIPILNAYFLITDTVKAIEVIYGLVSGKGYSFSMDDDAGGSGEGDDPSSGRAAEGEGVDGESGEAKEAAEAAEAAEDAEFAGLENEEAGGRPALKPAGLNPNAKEVYDALLQRSGKAVAGLDLTVLNDLVSGELTEEQLARLLADLGSAKRAGSAMHALTQVVAAARKAVAAPDQVGGGGGSGVAGAGGVPGVAGGQPDADIVLLDDAPTAANPVPSKEGTSDQPAQLDPDLQAFMGRAERSGQGSYVELEGDLSEDSLTVGRVLSGLATVQILTKVKGFDEAGEAIESERLTWYGGRAQFKVVGRSPGRVEVVRSTMEGYTRHGRYGGTVQAARLTLGDQRQPVAVGSSASP